MSAEVVRHNIYRSNADSASSSSIPTSMPYLTSQYALPIHYGHSKHLVSTGYGASGEQTPRPENTLRRKTPNGTLSAGYDGAADIQPQKHQLLVNEAHGYASAGSSKRTFLEHQQRQNGAQGAWGSQPAFGWQGSQYPPTMSLPVMDSMLYQMPLHHHYNAQQYFNQSVPSVLQPPFQHLGPTASGGQVTGPYGPYWHDGTFVPYRPAAVRDPRFYHHPPPPWTGSLPDPQLSHQAQLWQHHALSHGSPWAGAQGSALHPANIAPPLLHGAQPYHHISHDYRQPAYTSSTSAPLNDSAASVLDLAAEYGASSPNGRQRDKIFAWALQQYRELLAYMHSARRHQQQQQQQQGRHASTPSVSRPAFYPKPPKLPAVGSSVTLSKRRAAATTSSHSDASVNPSNADNIPNISSRQAEDESTTPKARSSSAWTPSGVQLQDIEYDRRVSYDQWQRQHPQTQQWHHPPQAPVDRFKTLRRTSGSSVSPIVSQPPPDDSPPSRAAVALTYMTQLCQDTDWQWTDGMHLGGCLAYGLGNYQKALRWYNKVLEQDPKHLEATSNLAATLLATGRRTEAEEHWMKVIKAAPNHFEAVEHLVGLLCNDQRGHDAIRVIEYVERSLRQSSNTDTLKASDRQSECSSSNASRSPCRSDQSDRISFDFDADGDAFIADWQDNPASSEPGFGSSGFAVPGCDNGRILALIHAKGNMLYGLGDNAGAARAFEDAVLIAAGRGFSGIQGLVTHIMAVVSSQLRYRPPYQPQKAAISAEPILLTPDQALSTSRLCFPHIGELPGLQYVPGGPQSIARKAVISTTSNSLLSLAKIFQDGMSNTGRSAGITPLAHGVRDILALYYLSLSLQPSPSTANNVGILLASVQQTAVSVQAPNKSDIPGIMPGSGIALALQYYNYGLQLDQNHAHLYTNLGSLLKDINQLDAAINMYERAVKCDGKFDIALANLANAVKDKGRISEAIVYYKRAVEVSPEFAEAVCGLVNALNSVCGWQSRGGIAEDGGKRDRWHVDSQGMLRDARQPGTTSSGWIKRVVDIVEKQLKEGEGWGYGTLTPSLIESVVHQLTVLDGRGDNIKGKELSMRQALSAWAGQKWEGARITRLIERATRRIGWQWYRDLYVDKKQRPPGSYDRPRLPSALTVPTAPTVLPFHTFTCPMSAEQIRLISQRNGLRISVSTLQSPWLPKQVFPPPRPPAPYLKVGYVSSDFNNHPLAHLMQSVFGLHDPKRVKAYCYATTASDGSVHRQQIQAEAPVFHDASGWSVERIVQQIVADGIHILVNLNGYTRGARNEVFAARPAPIQMSFMGFAGTLGAEWCDYLLADETAIPPDTLRPYRRNVDLEDSFKDGNCGSDDERWVYGENVIFCRDTFFCCDHKQSSPEARQKLSNWDEELTERWRMRKELFPRLSDDTVIFGNFNQLYKIDPTTFRTWLRILARVPNSILWLLRFPDLGEHHLLNTARIWAGENVASRVIFTDVAPKHLHISRARICDLVLDTAECNAHTTAADVLWSGTPLLTLPRYGYKMCSRMAASILLGALPKNAEGVQAGRELVAKTEEEYEEMAVKLGGSLTYHPAPQSSTHRHLHSSSSPSSSRHLPSVGGHVGEGRGTGRLMELRHLLYHARWTSALFDTRRWTRDLEDAFEIAWARYVDGEGGDIWLK
ncbi:TPR-like protein [Hortaea werneckii]|nr:TPR-like protein [Hortaea werneckii]